MAAPAFKIGDDTYEIPSGFTLGDGVLIRDLTGLEFSDFAERLDELQGDGDQADMMVVAGLVAVAVRHAHPKWPRQRVVAFVEQVDLESFAVENGADEGDAVPPVVAPSRSNGRSGASTSSPAVSSAKDPG